ncbi:MAG TPA: NAD(P)/FAD-dependent oxidoreductase, partial [Thermoleophilaceae bacterium]|nr:NAD(P)/FAD-dependent oxidoreductase [Thermoleophilaceae bacterium]
DDGSAGVMARSIEATADGLGKAGPSWRALFGRPSAGFTELGEDILRPPLHLPRHPLRLARFGLPCTLPATILARLLPTPQAKALFGGVAAHAYCPLSQPLSSAVGVALISAGHHHGWPVAEGGSGAITAALAAALSEAGGTVETGARVATLGELRGADIVIFDLAPREVLRIAGRALPGRVRAAYRRYRHGPGAFKLDLAVEGGVPWTNPACRAAGTVHAIGGFHELVRAEAEINRGRMPDRPFVLVGQQHLADPGRSAEDLHPLWAYAHVPAGYAGDATGAMLAQIERFAPGFHERIVATAVRSTADLADHNPNFVGGDILGGANSPIQIGIRPRLALDPYSCGVGGLYICSAATPPGPGVHGMGGYHAARSALRGLD